MGYRKFTDLNVYKECRNFRIEIAKIVKANFPNEEKFALKSQIIRSSRSVTANIAEGYGRFYYKDNVRFCRIARGSLEETLEHLITALDENYIEKNMFDNMKKKHEICLKLLNGYMRYLASSKTKEIDEGK